MNSFTDGKPLDQGTGVSAPVIISRPKTTPRYGLFAMVAALGLLIYIVYELQMTKTQLKEFQTTQSARSAALEEKLVARLSENEKSLDSLHSDFKVVQDKLGVTQRELDSARAMAQRVKADTEQTVQQLNQQISKKADSQQLSAFKEEASTKGEATAAAQETSGPESTEVTSSEETKKEEPPATEVTKISQRRDGVCER